ncbi:RNA polymerase sigma factor [Paraflavitalea pollutisoli]|uniref:RNA polymerase sigma factor n=1 Tax=Paraflavitalea pollutisoli TaxID=3034143 RepID=UPI0023EAFAC7|nr:sigma-70 family RNA polymerase sigma factor [Paraflavitalea sp. H1-2-19X]
MPGDQEPVLLPHLFRTEYRKIVSVLYRHFGFDAMTTAEDIASETFLTAAQTWGVQGTPANPVAWLYQVARNKAINQLQRQRTYHQKIMPALAAASQSTQTTIDLSPQNINDSQLLMMFTICHPAIPAAAQIGLALRILCGFGIDEIAAAFLTSKDTINKRLYRARETLREAKIVIELPPPNAIDARLETVLTTIYLLFNEGYYSLQAPLAIRRELCLEAMRLCTMLVEHSTTNTPPVNALLALMCFHASRLDARLDEHGGFILYAQQDSSRWNSDLISKGGYFLRCAASGNTLSKYHLEAGIAWWHTQQTDSQEKWEHILQHYNHLLQIDYSALAALNRTYALAKARDKLTAIPEAEKLSLHDHPFYHLLLGDLYTGIDEERARQHLHAALQQARTEQERQVIRKKLDVR